MNEQAFVILSMILFLIGLSGFLFLKRTVLSLILYLEIMLFAANINFVAFSMFFNSIEGRIFAFLTIITTAAQIVIGLSLLVNYSRKHQLIDVGSINKLKG